MHKMRLHIPRIHLTPQIAVPKTESASKVGKSETQKGQRLTLKCPSCNRTLRIYYKKKTFTSPAKLVVLNGSVHQTEKTTKIHVRCKCGNKVIFKRQSPDVSRYGWRRIQ
jgi:hypothetical protein